MRKKLFTFLLALVTSVGMSWATDPIVITTNTQQSSYIHSTVIITCDNDGDGDGFAIGGNTGYTATITNLGSSTISEIVLVPGYYKSNHPYVRANGAAPTTSSNDLITFTDVNSNSVTLSMSTTNNFQIKEVRVTLVGGGSTDQDVADAVIALINAIPNPVEYNATCYDAIALARALYDNLTDAQKALVSNYSTLTAAEAAYAALAPQPVSGDVLPGAFTINGDGDQINFSKANLQYAGSPATWKFAENQWSIIGAAQADDNRDLFGWGTGDAPNKVSSELSDYADYHEWGENMGEGWYTLSRDEWYYLFKTRDNASTLCGPAVVNGVSGIIILPDDWTLPGGMSFNPSATNFGANAYADEAWETMENAGAVFLPVAGYRYNGNINWVGQSGYYWSSSVASAGASAWCYRLTKDNVSREYYNLHYGMCVRLVKAVVKSDQEFADPVIALIEAIGTVEYTQVCKNRIDAARAAYDHLTDAQKALVINYSTLTNAEATYASLAPTPATDGSLPGAFTINGDGDQINFSKGNLQYVGSWQFAANQWDIIGAAQADDNRDLFGWGTGDAPNKVSMTLADYAEYHEWGTNMGDGWYTLSRDEWTYLFQTRTNAANLYAPANVNGVNGFVVLPDEWVQPYGTTFTPGVTNYGTNVYADAAWTSMEDAGAVFLPVAGYRYNGNVNWQGQSGFYWSSTVASEGASAWSWLISASDGARRDHYNLYYGMPVRLVKAVVKSDQEFADPVIALIEAIGSVEYTQDCKNRIDAARAAYDHLTDAQKALVINYSTLTNAETTYASLAPTPATDGSLSGAFTINANGDQIVFSKGNLQYHCTNHVWQFATNQYDIIGGDNANISDSYDGWIDLFGYGTGNNPTLVSTSYGDYSTFTDWGVNAISNGGNEANLWRTLTSTEWLYMFRLRPEAHNKYGAATVANVPGIIVLPDVYVGPAINTVRDAWVNNVISSSEWAAYEAAGAVFLPAAGYRSGTTMYNVGSEGFCWSSTPDPSDAEYSYKLCLSPISVIEPQGFGRRNEGISVRLIKAASAQDIADVVIALINAIPNPVAYNDECKDAIDAARAAYDALTDAQKDLVANYGVLTDAETAYAQLIPHPHGECGAQGNNLLWDLDPSTGVLTITGSGAMNDWAVYSNLPWYDNRSEITSVVLPSGITSIGTQAFRECTNLASINMTENYPAGLTAINQEAFFHTALTSVTIPESVVTIGRDAFFQNENITDVYCYADPNNLTWNDFWCDDFKNADHATDCHVKACALSIFEANWGGTPYNVKTSTGVNVTFVGDLPGDCPAPTPTNEQVPTNADPENPSYHYSTFFHSTQNYKLTNDGTQAFIADLSNNDLVLTEIANGTQVIPANTAVILRKTGSADPVVLTPTEENGVSVNPDDNSLEGVDDETAITSIDGLTATNCYVLSGTAQYGVGFYRILGSELKAHKAYVKYAGLQNNAPKRMRFIFNQEQTTTGVESVRSSVISSQKLIENGQLIIIKNGVKYNAQGQIVK